MIKYRPRLLQCHPGKPFDELRYQSTIFEILEKCGNGHAGTAKYPSAADTRGVSLYSWAGRPINHVENGSTFAA